MLNRNNIKAIYHLSPMQEGMFFNWKYNPSSSTYFNQASYRIKGDMDIDIVKQSLRQLYLRHDILRTVFVQKTTERPLQIVLKEREIDIGYHDIMKLEDKEAFIKAYKQKDIDRNFDLEKDLLMRMSVIRTGQDEYEFIWSFHHILMDGWCIAVLTREYYYFYDCILSGKPFDLPPAASYKSYIDWLEGQDNNQAIAFWGNYLNGYSLAAGFPQKQDIRDRGFTYMKQRKMLTIDGELFDSLQSLSVKNNTTLSVLAQTIWGVLLSRYNNSSDVVFGAVVSGRPAEVKGIESMIGLFINTVPVRVKCEPGVGFQKLLRTIHKDSVESFGYQYVSLAGIQSVSGLGQNLFDQIFVFENYPITARIEGVGQSEGGSRKDLKILSSEFFDVDGYGLNITVNQSNGLNILIEYSDLIYDDLFIDRLLVHLKYIIEKIAGNADVSVDELRMSIPESEREEILFKFNNTDTLYQLDRTIIDIFEENVKKFPDNIAVACGVNKLTYQELNQRSNQLAAHLIRQGIQKEELVPLACHRSVEMLVGIMGIFKAGAAFAILDTSYPVKRLSAVIKEINARFILTASDAFEDPSLFYTSLCRDTVVKDIIHLDAVANLNEVSASVNTLYLYNALLKEDWPYDVQTLGDYQVFRYNDQMVSSTSLQKAVEQLSRFLAEREIDLTAVGVFIENPVYGIVTMLALREMGITPRILSSGMSKEDRLFLVREQSITTLLTQYKFIDEVDALQWQIDHFNCYVLIDQFEVNSKSDMEWEAGISEMFDYEAEKGTESTNDYGWVSSYTRKPFPIEVMNGYINNFCTKLGPFLDKQTRVMEIGCGHGLVAFNLAPKAKEYVATDLSALAIAKNRRKASREGFSNLDFRVVPASGIATLQELGRFDVIICSSVIHFFPNTLFLEDVIDNAIRLLGDKGTIYIDEILDLRKKPDIVYSNVKYNEDHGVKTAKTNWDEDLFIHPLFWHGLRQRFGDIAEVEITDKLGEIDNELKMFRYDVVLKIDKNRNKESVENILTGSRHYDFNIENWLTGDSIRPDAPESSPITVKDLGDLQQLPTKNPGLAVAPGDLSFIIYTSGSTGKPKGAMNEHIGMLNHCFIMIDHFGINAASAIAQTAPPSFDIIVWQLLTALVAGGRTVIYPKELILDPLDFIERIRQDGITLMQLVPSYLAVLLEEIEGRTEHISLPGLTHLIVCGEVIRPSLVSRWFKQFPAVRVANAYGPAEASDDVTIYMMDQAPEMDFVSIGKPVANCHILILDEQMRLCPVGCIGEICVSGIGVGRGYLNNEDKTKAVFKPDPFRNGQSFRLYRTGDLGRWLPDGNIEFLGRKDYQVKVRGQRVELGEIESRLAQLRGVKDVIVTEFVKDGNISLCAYVIFAGNSTLDIDGIRKQLSEELPDFMVPEHFVEVTAFPVLANGKVNRKALTGPQDIVSSDFMLPSGDTEEKLYSIWKDILSKERISANDNFFEIGGNSLKAIQLISRIHKDLGIKLPLKTVFIGRTIKNITREIDNVEWMKGAPSGNLAGGNLDEITI